MFSPDRSDLNWFQYGWDMEAKINKRKGHRAQSFIYRTYRSMVQYRVFLNTWPEYSEIIYYHTEN